MKRILNYLCAEQIRMKKDDYETSIEMTRIGNRAIQKAQEENRKLGLANVYSKNKKIYYELPDGTITMEAPIK